MNRVHELLDVAAGSCRQFGNHRLQVVSQCLREQSCLVLEVGHLTLHRGIPFRRFLGESRVLLPGVRRHVLSPGKHLRGVDAAQQGIAQSNLADAHVVEGLDSRNTLLVQLRHTRDEALKGVDGVALPVFYKLLFRHPADPGEVLKRLAARNGGDLHVDQGLRYGRTARLSLYANRRKRRVETKHLCLRQSGLPARTGDAHSHLNDGRFGGGEVITQLGDHTAHVAE